MSNRRTCNLLGAFVTAMQDSMNQCIEMESSFGGETPAALVTVGHNSGCTVDFLSRAVGLSHSGTVRLVDRLERSNLIKRKAAADTRAVALHLTEPGVRKMQRILLVRNSVLSDTIKVLSEREQKQLAAILERMLTHVTDCDETAESICKLCEVDACPQERCPVTLALEE